MADFKFDIVEHLGVISENSKGWTKELNLVRMSAGISREEGLENNIEPINNSF